MTNLNDPENDGREKTEDYWVMASYIDEEGFIEEAQIGEVTILKDLPHTAMPFGLEINGVLYKRED